MVLKVGRRARCASRCGGALLVLVLAPGVAGAQQIEQPQSIFGPPAEEYKPYGLHVGDLTIKPTATVRAEYDNNIYAATNNRVEDGKVIVNPRLDLELNREKLRINAAVEARLRRYFERTSENSNGFLVGAQARFQPDGVNSFTAVASWQRVVEDRGDPEARTNPTTGPRLYNALNAELRYVRTGGRVGFDVRGGFTRLRYLSSFDEERDYDGLSLSAQVNYRVSGPINVFGRGFLNTRRFRLEFDNNGIRRDADTYGAQAGLAFDEGGKLSGDLGIGVFRFDPKDPTIRSRTGVSAQGSLTYKLTQRLAFTLDAFRGDVATVRSGAQSRTDTRVQLGVQQEVRHNLRWQAGVLYRRSDFIGSGVRETTKGGFGEIEYLVSRNLALALTGRFADRESSDPLGDFDRFRGGLELRLKY